LAEVIDGADDKMVGNGSLQKITERKEQMKIAVTSQGKDLSSEVDPRFGRAKWLIVVDTDTGEFKAHDNTVNFNAVSGAGIQTGQNIASLGVDAVITGNVGPNAFKTLNAANIKVFLCKASKAQDALEMFKAGKLQQVTSPNVESHWV
jgi:predicted Fe-Mo cluster-binding NifX family protein